MTHRNIKIGVVGLGTMGSGIAQLAAVQGHNVFVFDASDKIRISAKAGIEKNLNKQKERGKLTDKEASEILARLHVSNEFPDLAECGIVFEAIIEDIKIKQKVFSELESNLADDAILATNTSSLSVNGIMATCKNRKRALGAHFFNPAQIMPLVEVIPTIDTSPEILARCKEIVTSWGKVVVIAQDSPGFIVNRIARPFYGEALKILEESISDIATIDWAMKEIGGFRMGPFELMDFIGNDINYSVSESVFTAFYYDPRFRPSLTQKRMVDSGFLGRKTGRGYYDYAPGVIPPEPKKDRKLGEEIFMRILSMLVNEAADALYLKVATREDIDLAMERGVNYPKGLLRWADEIGLKNIFNVLSNLHDTYGDDRYRPQPLLRRLAKDGKKFYD